MSDFILKVFLIRHLREAGLDKVSTEIQGPHFPAPTVIYKDFQGALGILCKGMQGAGIAPVWGMGRGIIAQIRRLQKL